MLVNVYKGYCMSTKAILKKAKIKVRGTKGHYIIKVTNLKSAVKHTVSGSFCTYRVFHSKC